MLNFFFSSRFVMLANKWNVHCRHNFLHTRHRILRISVVHHYFLDCAHRQHVCAPLSIESNEKYMWIKNLVAVSIAFGMRKRLFFFVAAAALLMRLPFFFWFCFIFVANGSWFNELLSWWFIAFIYGCRFLLGCVLLYVRNGIWYDGARPNHQTNKRTYAEGQNKKY